MHPSGPYDWAQSLHNVGSGFNVLRLRAQYIRGRRPLPRQSHSSTGLRQTSPARFSFLPAPSKRFHWHGLFFEPSSPFPDGVLQHSCSRSLRSASWTRVFLARQCENLCRLVLSLHDLPPLRHHMCIQDIAAWGVDEQDGLQQHINPLLFLGRWRQCQIHQYALAGNANGIQDEEGVVS